MALIARFINDESGEATVEEYAIVVVLFLVLAVAVFWEFGSQVVAFLCHFVGSNGGIC